MAQLQIRLNRGMLAMAAMVGLVLGMGVDARADTSLDFSTPIVTGPSPAPGVWSPDRYAPNSFGSPAFFQGDWRLEQSIRATDAQGVAFYNTQGYGLGLEAGTLSQSIDLYVSSDWASLPEQRFAGFWGVGVDAGNAVQSYAIIEFATIGGAAGFRTWDSSDGTWNFNGLPSGFLFDSFNTLSASLEGGNYVYSLNGQVIDTVTAFGATSFDRVLLQGHNTPVGVNYDIFWDNYASSTTAVPEPSSLVLLGMGATGLVIFRRRTAGPMAAR